MKTFICSTTVERMSFIGEVKADVDTDGKSAEVKTVRFVSTFGPDIEPEDMGEGAYQELCDEAIELFNESDAVALETRADLEADR